ncbi:MAG: 2-hydroxyacyl-CoA dehydratase family protein [Peptococcaceae bacterium]|jgi:benzoyl-CoA reductase/2-hydroxyglutaryl-CoA dehydratase subunit BcrC/BadD/HgdB|nr:2-hydroxyacyl-CoA dehydratase family protein [Peptococcaceae bacterium]
MDKSATSREMLDYYLKKSYADAAAAKKSGKKICWATSISPCEFCETLGIHMLYPENHAAAIAARHGAEDMIQVAERKGYCLDICSYARLNLAYADIGRSVAEEMPLPDFLLVCNNICEVVIKWFENLSYELKIPLITLDMPYNYGPEPTERGVDYIVAQFEDCVRQMEIITGNTFDWQRFNEVMDIALESSFWWLKAMSLASANPSPLNGFDMFNYMALIVCLRGKNGCRDTFRKLTEELEEKIRLGYTAFPGGEKYRIMWEGIACWPYLNFTFRTMRNSGMNLTGSTYPVAWALEYDRGDLRSLARAYASTANNSSLPGQIDLRVRVMREYGCEGATYHMNRSCKTMAFLHHEMQGAVSAATNTPFISFDGDQSDPRNFSGAQFETRIQGLREMIDQRRQARPGREGEL